MHVKKLFWFVVVLNLVDCFMTTIHIRAGAYEVNPYVNWFLIHLGPFGVMAPKLLPLTVLGLVVYNVRSTLLSRSMVLVVVTYTSLVVYQIGLILV